MDAGKYAFAGGVRDALYARRKMSERRPQLVDEAAIREVLSRSSGPALLDVPAVPKKWVH
jgi:hypothetical protein